MEQEKQMEKGKKEVQGQETEVVNEEGRVKRSKTGGDPVTCCLCLCCCIEICCLP